MSTNQECPNKQDNVLVAKEEHNQSDSQGKMKLYRVTLRTHWIVDVDVSAENEVKARAKAFSWGNSEISGYSDVGTYYWADEDDQGHLEDGDDEMFWNVTEGDYDIVNVVELNDRGNEGVTT